ncbi:outer membrane protein assembly factor BamD [Sodalis-like secondary symbiont of Drepanosiphum platanoidis]|uniref:outer membrane protein assembly factor BamD n=1 Tax=Sodalis-like secondary symbiont of Drepanosiphum platanoidis TaxID=2994493 RepID=UPI003464DA91
MKYIIIIFLSFLLYNCSFKKNCIYQNTIYDKYIFAINKIKNKKYKDSIKILKKLEKKNQFGIYTEKIRISLINSYYLSSNYYLAKKLIEKFIKNNPFHKKSDYLIYLHGLINISINNNKLKKIFRINQFEHNNKYIKEALCDFNKIINNYPKSKYILSSIKRSIILKHKLAQHELKIIKYYINCNAYKAVIYRTKNMINNFPYTKETYKALFYMKKSYKKLKNFNKEKNIKNMIKKYYKYFY